MRRSLPQRAKHQPSPKPVARGNKGEPRSSSPFCIAIPPHCNMPPDIHPCGWETNKHVALLGITNWRSRQTRPRNPTSCQLRSVLSPWVPHVGARQGQHATCPNNATAPQHAPTSTRAGGRTDRHLALLGIIEDLGTPTPQAPTRCSHGTNTDLHIWLANHQLPCHRAATCPQHPPEWVGE